MATFRERMNQLVGKWDTRWSAAAHIWGALTLIASAGIPAWATWAAGILSQYAPLSWVIGGFAGTLIWSLARLVLAYALRIRVNAKYDARFIEHGGNFNPLDLIFERRRIYLNDFALPSHPIIEGKTFVDCDIIGPANVYWHFGNQAPTLRQPIIDAIILEPNAKFLNGFVFQNCIFRNCSFQRITVFAGAEWYPTWNGNPHLNLISIPPSQEQIEARQRIVGMLPVTDASTTKAAPPIVIEGARNEKPAIVNPEE
jgi:hypothetical protein